MTNHTIKAHMEMKAGAALGAGLRAPTRADLITRIAEKSREVEQIQCADDHERFAHRVMAALDVINDVRMQETVARQHAAESFRKKASEATWPGKEEENSDGVRLQVMEHPKGSEPLSDEISPESIVEFEPPEEPAIPSIPGVEDDPR